MGRGAYGALTTAGLAAWSDTAPGEQPGAIGLSTSWGVRSQVHDDLSEPAHPGVSKVPDAVGMLRSAARTGGLGQ
jgi:hypothetical protein